MSANVGVNALLAGLLGGRRGGSINGFLNAPNYDEERQKDAMLNYGTSLMGSQNQNNSTSGAVRQLGERLLGAVMTGYREKNYRDKEKTLEEQWGAITGGGDAPAQGAMPAPKPMEGSTGDTAQDASSFEALAGGTAKGINPDDWAKTFGGATVVPAYGAKPNATYAQRMREKAKALFGDKLDPKLNRTISSLEQYEAFTEPERRRQETLDAYNMQKLDLEQQKLKQDIAARDQEIAAGRELSGIVGGGSGGGYPAGGSRQPESLPSNITSIAGKYASEFKLDPALVNAVILTESGGNPKSVSKAGATGVMQLMPGTAKDLGVDPNDLESNIRGGSAYLRQMIDRYGGNEEHALLAYNWGPGNVDAWLKTGKGMNGQDMPAETRNYVAAVRRNMGGNGGQGSGGKDFLQGLPTDKLIKIAMMGGKAGQAAQFLLSMKEKEDKKNAPASLTDTNGLAKRWTSESSGYLGTADALNQLISYAKEDSGAGDLGMIFAYMKALDPQSVVREGEQVQVQRTGGIPEHVWNMYLQAKDGRRLSSEQRTKLISAAGSRYKDALRVQKNRNIYFTDLSTQHGIDPSLIIQDLYAGLEDRLSEALIPVTDAPPASVPGISGEKISSDSGSEVNRQRKAMSDIFGR